MNSQPARFGELFSSAWTLFKDRFSIIFPGAVIFTIITVITQLPLPALSGPASSGEGMLAAGSVAAGIIGSIAGIISGLYLLIAVIRKDASVGAVFTQVWPRVFPFIGLSLLTMLKTYTWIALVGVILAAGGMVVPALAPIGFILIAVGIVCGVIFGPRYMLGGVLWLVEGKDVRTSVNRSYQITEGYWGKVVGNSLLVVLIFMAVMIGVGIVAGIVGGAGGAVGGTSVAILLSGLITGFVSQCYSGFMSAFLLKLAATIVTNPRTGGTTVSAAPAAPTPVKKALKKPQATMKKTTVKKTAAKKITKKA